MSFKKDIAGKFTWAKPEVTKVEAELKIVEPFLTDTAKRAIHTFWEAELMGVPTLLAATSLSSARDIAISTTIAAGAATYALVKGIVTQKVKELRNA